MMDDAWFQESDRRTRQLVALVEQIDAAIAANRAAMARLDERAK